MKKYLPYGIQALISVGVFLIGLFIYGKLIGPVSISSEKTDPNKKTFSVEGVGTVTVTPDKYYTDLNITESGKTQEEAKDAANAVQEKALEALKKIGFKDADIKTTSFSVNPDYDYSIISSQPAKPRITGYTAYVSTQVTSKSQTNVEKAIDELTKLNVNVSGVQSTVGDTEKYKNEARVKAIDNAKKKAQSMAEAAGFKLGELVSIKESDTPNVVFGRPMPVAMKDSMELSVSTPATQINPGSDEISAQVTITYTMR